MEKDHPVFSIVIPVYNVEQYLERTLDSVLCQSFKDWECFCIDDGSLDSSGKILEKYAQKDKRFCVFHQQNAGVSAARNAGLSHCQGSWIWFVDADDLIHPDALQCLQQAIEAESPAEVIYFDYLMGKNIEFTTLPQEITVKKMTDYSLIPMMSAWQCVFSRALIQTAKFEPFIVGEDLLFTAQQIVKARAVAYMPQTLYGYVSRGDSVMHRLSFKRTADTILCAERMMFFLNREGQKFGPVHLRKRWNAFFFVYPMEINLFSGRDFEKLANLWFQGISDLSQLHLPIILSVWRNFYIEAGRIRYLRRLLLRINILFLKIYQFLLKR